MSLEWQKQYLCLLFLQNRATTASPRCEELLCAVLGLVEIHLPGKGCATIRVSVTNPPAAWALSSQGHQTPEYSGLEGTHGAHQAQISSEPSKDQPHSLGAPSTSSGAASGPQVTKVAVRVTAGPTLARLGKIPSLEEW